MAICKKCGEQMPDNTFSCPKCGTPNVSIEGDDYSEQYDQNDIQKNKGMAVLSYIGFLFLVPLLAAPQSKFARFHVNQGLVLFIAEAIMGAIVGVCFAIPAVGATIGGIVSSIEGLISLIYMILGIVNASSGKAKELPLIGKISIIK